MHLELVDPCSRYAERTWRRLEAEVKPAYFLTWAWIENWLTCLPTEEIPRLALVFEQGIPVSAFFLGRRRVVRHSVLPSRALFLNTTGDDRWDELCIEHNQILGRDLSIEQLIELLPTNWDELFLPALRAQAFETIDERVEDKYSIRIDRRTATHYVDLERVRASKDGYIALLGSSTRAAIRKAQRKAGPIEIEVATTIEQALAIYEEMGEYHGAYWRSRGQAGAFADPWFDRFHRRLIAQRFEHGEIQMVRVRAGGETLGCLYNLIANGNILFYQSGLQHQEGRDLKPGYLCHVAAVEHSAAAGHSTYDFLAGDAQYK
ncbi:MAG: GNAT family N-acetyltransferase, partial [Deltaproteobacteria bacterium]|nr:GNAT family N-acetyltransferase [Deltaproteobacteria bacterium]